MPLVAELRPAAPSALPAVAAQGDRAQAGAVGRPEHPVSAAAPARPVAATAPASPAVAEVDTGRDGDSAAKGVALVAGATRAEVARDAAETGAAARPTAPPSDGLEPEGVRRYRMALALQARHHKRYPPRALADGLSGTAEVRIRVAAGGVDVQADLARSSGYDALDDAALEMLRLAARQTSVPDSLRARAFAVSLPVVFDLRDQ